MSLMTISSGKITDSASIVPIKKVINVTTSRAINGTKYTNTTGRTLFVFVNIRVAVVTAGNYSYADLRTDSSIQRIGLYTNGNILITGIFIVKPREQYWVDVVSNENVPTLFQWIEAY